MSFIAAIMLKPITFQLCQFATFAGAVQKKIRTYASFKKTLLNYILVVSLIHVVSDKNIISVTFCFTKYQEQERIPEFLKELFSSG